MERIGQGNTAEIYAWEEQNALKLFYNGISKAQILQEYETVAEIQKHIPNTPAVHGLIAHDGRTGILYDRFRGQNMLEALLRSPGALDAFGEDLAQLHWELHRVHLTTDRIPSVRRKLAEDIRHGEGLSPAEKETLLARLLTLPEGNALCHFDFHPGNVILEGTQPILIDWMTACIGDPCADVARTCLLLRLGEMPGASPETQAFIRAFQKQLWEAYFPAYLARAGIQTGDVQQWIPPVAAARLREWITDSERRTLLAVIRESLEVDR